MIKTPFSGGWKHTGKDGLSEMKKFIAYHPHLNSHEKYILGKHFDEVFENKEYIEKDIRLKEDVLYETKARDSLKNAHFFEIKKFYKEKGEMFFDPSKKILPIEEKTVEIKKVSGFKKEVKISKPETPKPETSRIGEILAAAKAAREKEGLNRMAAMRDKYNNASGQGEVPREDRGLGGIKGSETANPAPSGYREAPPKREFSPEPPMNPAEPMGPPSDFN